MVVYDNLAKGHRDAVPPGATFVHGDLGDAQLLRETLRRGRVEAVVHMAADSLVGESIVDPAKYYANNVGNGLALLDAMRELGDRPARLLVHRRGARRAAQVADRASPTRPTRSTRTARPSSPSSARCAGTTRPTVCTR